MKRILLTGLIFVSCASCATVGDRFVGTWGYVEKCGQEQVANIELRQQGRHVEGSWDDGTPVKGWDGSLIGEIRSGKVYVRKCTVDGRDDACPHYGEESDRFEREGERLVWYRGVGENARKYLTLHPVKPGDHVPVDDHCAGENEDE